ncbi:MAG: (d)CMP kinase [Candidatus Eremiobacteraeota bacterium]|nr:(d)CMP kinase [Candidatus Eremiobacteraeota bacterium]
MTGNVIGVAIDGPVASGKSTVAKKVADRLGFLYLDTGAMYRAISWTALEKGIWPGPPESIVRLARESDMMIKIDQNSALGYRVFIDGKDITSYLHSPEVSDIVSPVSEIPEIREILVEKQRNMAKNAPVVMAGRDIGTVVLPFAIVKIFLTASVAERARRRYEELKERGIDITLSEVEKNLQERDRIDSTRATSPLKPADDAIILDCTDIPADKVADRIVNIVRNKIEEMR